MKLVCLALVCGLSLACLPSPARAADPTPTLTPMPSPTGGAPAATVDKKDPEAYNYLPLTFKPVDNGNLRDSIIEGLIFQNGYEVQCAAPQWKIKPELFGAWKRWFELHEGQVMVAKSKSSGDEYRVNMTNARLPMLRGSEDFSETNKISSLEAFFGTVNPALPAGQPNSVGVVQNLLNLSQQCSIKSGNLVAIKEICDKLDSGSECYLNRVIPKTAGLKMLSLLDVLDGAETTYKSKLLTRNAQLKSMGEPQLPTNFCDAFTQADQIPYDMFGFKSEAEHQTYSQALLNTPLDVDTLYRIAFLVIAPTQNIDGDAGGKQDIFWFLQNPEKINAPLEAPIIVAFRVPDFTMNKPLALKTLQDSGKVTNHLLKTQELNKNEFVTALDRRSNFMKKVMDAKDTNLTDPNAHIYCPNLEQCLPPSNQPTELRQALIDIVNGLGPKPSCDGMGGYIENAGDISTSTHISNEKKTFQPQFWQALLPQIDPQADHRPFKWNFTVSEKDAKDNFNDPDKSVEVNAWIISPSGIDLVQFEGALQSFFTLKGFNAMVKANCLPDEDGKCGVYPERYPFKAPDPQNPIAKFYSSSSEVEPFIDPEDPWEIKKITVIDYVDPVTGKKHTHEEEQKVPKYKHAGAMLVENKGDLGIKGAKLGWLVRKIEDTVRPLDIQIKCSRTEDLFLGKCKIVPKGQTGNNGGIVPSSQIPCALELAHNPDLDKYVLNNEADYLAEIRKFFPRTLMSEASFKEAGEDLYKFAFDYTVSHGWNPALILALGREETAWGGVGDPHMLGCMAGDPASKVGPKAKMQQQMDCVFQNFQNTVSCTRFECKYGPPGIDSDSCNFVGDAIKFPTRIDFYYRTILAPFKPVDTNHSITPIPQK